MLQGEVSCESLLGVKGLRSEEFVHPRFFIFLGLEKKFPPLPSWDMTDQKDINHFYGQDLSRTVQTLASFIQNFLFITWSFFFQALFHFPHWHANLYHIWQWQQDATNIRYIKAKWNVQFLILLNTNHNTQKNNFNR